MHIAAERLQPDQAGQVRNTVTITSSTVRRIMIAVVVRRFVERLQLT
jgi:hypothetical protein